MNGPADLPGLRFSTGPHDPRLEEFDADFAALLSRFGVMAQASHRTRRRFFHAEGAAVRGTAVFVAEPGPAPHPYFAPGRSVPVFARYSSGERADEVLPATRGLSLLFLDPERPDDPDRALFNLTLNTGRRLFARDAAMFHRFTFGSDADKEAMAQEFPDLRDTVWEQVREAVDYTRYHYHSQVPRHYVDGSGRQWLARYRVAPFAGAADRGHTDPGGRRFPVAPPGAPSRAEGDDRPPTLLSDALRERVTTGVATGLLQVRLHPLSQDADANRAALDPSLLWSEEKCPYRTIAELRFDGPLDGRVAEGLVFDPASAPEGLGIALASTPEEPASVNHVRALVYRMAHGARTGRRDPVAASGAPAAVRGGRPARQTVCVIGAGPAGLTVAHELQRLGHHTVVLESESDVGGKSVSVHLDGRAYDLGAHICTPQYAELAKLAAELGVDTEDATPTRVHDTGSATARVPDSEFFRPDSFARYTRLRAERFARIDRPGLSHSARELAAPVGDWLRANGLEAMAASLGAGYTASGYGHLRDDLPALYFVKYAELTGLVADRPSLGGHAGTFTVRDGFARLWQRVAAGLPDVRTGARVTAVERTEEGVTVRTGDGPVRADALVLTPALDRMVALLDSSEEERDIAGRIRTVDYYTVVCRISGLSREGFYLVDEHTRPSSRPGHCVAYHHRHHDSDIHTCYLYGADDLDSANVGTRLAEDVAALGGRVEEVLLVRRWPFMPHFSSADIAAGVLDRLEAAQGLNRTYHAGSLLGYELIETTVSYSRDLVSRFFADAADRAPTNPPDTETGKRGNGSVPAVPSTPPGEVPGPRAIEDWLLAQIVAETGEPADAHAPLADYLVDSLIIAELQGRLSQWLGFRVSPTLLLEQPTASAVAQHLGDVLAGAHRTDRAAPSPDGVQVGDTPEGLAATARGSR